MCRTVQSVLAASIVVIGLAAPGTAAAFDLETCTLTVTSKDVAGNVIDSATGGGPGGTREDPLTVDPNGSVEWVGATGGQDFEGASWHVEIYGVPTPLRGEDRPGDDPGGSEANRGAIKVGEILPFDLVGTIFVSGAVEVGGDPVCAGAGWIELPGDPTGTPGFIGAGILTLIGVGLVLSSARGRKVVRGGIGGVLAGAGLGTLAAIADILPFDNDTPLAVMIGSVLVGIAIGVIDIGDLFGAKPAPKPTPAPAAPSEPPASPPEARATAESLEQTPVPPTPVPPTPAPSTEVPPTEARPTSAPDATTPVPPTPAPPAPVEPTPEPPSEPTEPAEAESPAAGPAEPTAEQKLRKALDELPKEVLPQVEDLIRRAEAKVMAGRPDFSVPADELSKLAKTYSGAVKKVTLGDGVITAETLLGTARIGADIGDDGRIKVQVKGLLGGNETAADTIAGLLNTIGDAVVARGHRILGIQIGPSGVTIVTEPLPPPE